jgi:phosphopantetheine adenylyltransferase
MEGEKVENALLLLPAPKSPSFTSLQAAYGPALSIVFSDISGSSTNRTVLLDVAIVTPGLLAPESQPRARSFVYLQQLLAALYKLIGVTSTMESVDIDETSRIDTRVFFLDYNPAQSPGSRNLDRCVPAQGPIIALEDLATSNRSWSSIYSLETEDGEVLLNAFIAAGNAETGYDHATSIRKVPGMTGLNTPEVMLEKQRAHFAPHYSVAVGGTFDHLHAGHKLLLTATALALDPNFPQSRLNRRAITIGITGDEMLVNKKYAEYLETWEERWRGVWTFLESIIDFSPPGAKVTKIERVSNPGPNGKYVRITASPDLDVKFVQISDPFGPTITDESITALVVSKETRSGGQAVNAEREKRGLPKLEIFEVDVLESGEYKDRSDASEESFASKISSTEIRRRRMRMAKGNL